MGNTNSKRSRVATYPTATNLPNQCSGLTLSESADDSVLADAGSTLSISAVCKWEDKLLSDPKNRLALAALTTHAATSILQNPSALLADIHQFSDKIELEGSPVTNQRSSGRCWLFASTNVFRVGLMKKYKLGSFELSQSYLFFWDKLEKANFFLEQIIDTVDEPLDGRLVQYLLQGPVGDGGQWDMVVNLVEKYGLVPQKIFPDSFNAKSSGRINWLITVKLREAALHIRDLISSHEKNTDCMVAAYKAQILRDVHSILTLTLGAPPKPADTFTWSYVEKDGKYRTLNTTPFDFYHDNLTAVSNPGASGSISPLTSLTITARSTTGGIASRFSLVNDPRNPYLRLLTVKRLGNVHGARGVQYVNVSMETMKAAVIAMLQNHHPVFFGCDVGKFSDSEKGILDTDLFDYTLGFNVTLNLNKAQRLMAGESLMTHAMVISGVNLVDGKPTRWRVENSWGETAGEKGYLVMSDRWMDEYCYQAVVAPEFVSAEVRKVLDQEPLALELWDPMGSLA